MKKTRLTLIACIALLFVACSNVTPTAPVQTPGKTGAATAERSGLTPTAMGAPGTHTPVPVTTTPVPLTATPLAPTDTATAIPATVTAVPPTATPTNLPPTPFPTPMGELTAETDAGWQQFVASLEADDAARAQARVNAFWDLAVRNHRVPFITADRVIFLYKGDAQSVSWRGDFSYWQFGNSIPGKRIGSTDLWYGTANFPRDSRTEYEIVLNGSDGELDPANAVKRKGGFGYNSVLTMPDFRVTDFTTPRADVPHGVTTDWITLDSKEWGAGINYRVYTPPNYETLDHFPVLYVTDGNDFGDEEIGGMQTVVDNLIADGKIAPLMIVFIDARNAANAKDNQRETQFLYRPAAFAAFITRELVPTIDARYRTDTARTARGLMGVSFGGAFTTYAGLKYPDVFGNLVIFSPAYWAFDTTARQTLGDFVRATFADPSTKVSQKVYLSGGIPGWDVGDLNPWADLFRQHGADVQIFHSQEGHAWGAWSGLMDEMLQYFFGK